MNKKIHAVEILKTDSTYLYLRVDKQTYRIRWIDCSPNLVKANQMERDYMEISPSGYGLHWPLIDEDLAVTPLLEDAEKLSDELFQVAS